MNLTISHGKTKDLLILFQKQSEKDCSPIKLNFYNSTTKKKEEVVFYNYYEHLKKFSFEWENTAIDLKFSIKLSPDKRKLIKKITMSKEARGRI